MTRMTQKRRMHITGIAMARKMVSWMGRSEEGVGGSEEGMVLDEGNMNSRGSDSSSDRFLPMEICQCQSSSGDGERGAGEWVGGNRILAGFHNYMEDSHPQKLCFVHLSSPQRPQKELYS